VPQARIEGGALGDPALAVGADDEERSDPPVVSRPHSSAIAVVARVLVVWRERLTPALGDARLRERREERAASGRMHVR